MALWNFKPQSFLTSLFVKPFNSFISFLSEFVKPKQLPKNGESKPFIGGSEMKILSTFPKLPKNPNLTDRVNHLQKEMEEFQARLNFFETQQALRARERAEQAKSEKATAAPREERSFVARMFSR